MTCRELAEFLSDYTAGELDREVRATFEGHLSGCPNCVAYLDQFKTTIAAGKLACGEAGPADEVDAPEALIQAILAARRQ